VSKRQHAILWEASGAAGDLGTLLPLALGAIAVGGLAPQPVFAGFALSYLLVAVVYRLPVPVQPMKAVTALMLTSSLAPGSVATAGVMLGTVLLLLGATGLIDRLGRLVPQSVLTGLQLGLGISLALVALRLMAPTPLAAGLGLVVLAGLLIAGRLPAALVFLPFSVAAGWLLGLPGISVPEGTGAWTLPALPTAEVLGDAATGLVLPQLALTLTNAVILTALVARDRFGEDAARVTPRRLCLTTGVLNLLLAPFGALPMCHGAGGLAAHWRFGARTWAAPAMLGAALLGLALVPGAGLATLGLIPVAALGAMLFVAAVELGASRRLLDCLPSCRPVIGITALVTLLVDPFAGLLAGTLAEAVRKAVVARLAAADRPR